ncbi:hypothetical protein BGX21_007766 [Mortierella sp. AD011]|nr:hypothetical protein BGX20_000896 [Mortierella sp. AD010]KAF9398460.1 hypothetical protein BGX21_007766 [Mortierella sp. AD011]
MSWNEFLPELAVKHEVLETLYADIGTPENAKAKECQSLFDKFIDVINDHIQNVEQEKIRLVQECEQMMNDIKRMTGLVGQGEDGIVRLVETLQGMTLWDRHSLLREEYTYILEHYKQKLEEIRVLHRKLEEYVEILGPTYVQSGPFPEEGDGVTFEVFQQFSDNIAACEKEEKRRKSVVESTIITIKHLWNELGLTAQDAFEREIIDPNNDSYPVSDDAMRRLETKQAMLESERSKRETIVKEHQESIIQLWSKLHIDEDEREEFLTNHIGLTMDIIRAYKSELGRLEDLKGEKIEEFILDERDNLYELWDKLYYSLEQRENFAPVFDDNFTDENLAAHEAEVARLKQEAEENEHILDAIEQYRKMLDDIREFEITSMDAQRLFHRDPGRLLREEKFRKRIAREFPKIEKELEDALYEWQQVKGRPFLVYGEQYINTMKLHAQQAREGKENEKLWREQRRNLSLQRDLRYGSKNPKKAPQSPHPRRISPSLGESAGRRSPPPTFSSPQPQTPTTKRIGLPSSRPGTPSSQHVRAIPSFMPTTPTRARSQTLQTGQSGQNSLLQSPRSFQTLQVHRPNGLGGKFYSRSESPATSFSLAKPVSTPNSKQNAVRSSGPAVMLTSGSLHGEPNNRRSNSVISISSTTTEAAEFSTPTRTTRINRPISIDLTRHSIQEESDESLPGLRCLKRTAAELESPSNTPPRSPSVRHHRRKSRSLSPQTEVSSTRSRSRPLDSPFISKTQDRVDSVQVIAHQAGKGNRFMKQLLESREEQVVDVDEEMEAVEDGDEDSIVELDHSEVERFFAPKKATEVVELLDDQYESEGWETENEDSPGSRRQSRSGGSGTSSKISPHTM